MAERKRAITWLDHFENGWFSTELLTIKLTTPNGICHGQGFLDWDRRRGARIRAITDGAANLTPWDGSLRGLGKLVRTNQYSTLEATTLAGSGARIERIYCNSFSAGTANPAVVWDIRQRQIYSAIDFGAIDLQAVDPLTEVLLTNSEKMIWPRRFPQSLTFQSRWGTVRAWKRGRLSRVQIKHRGKCDLPSFLRGLVATFSFWSGSVVSMIALEHRGGESKLQRIFGPADSMQQIAPPMGVMEFLELNTAHEALLANALDYFADSKNEYIGRLAVTFLGSQRNTFSKNALVACTCLEGLAKLIADSQDRPPDRISAEQIKQVEEFLVSEGFSGELRNRFSGFISKINETSGANAINEWCRTGFLGFTREDGNAFNSLRNPAAHGSLDLFGDDDDAKQESIGKRDRIHNMLNKLFMHAMGYTGKYFDYGEWDVSNLLPSSRLEAHGPSDQGSQS